MNNFIIFIFVLISFVPFSKGQSYFKNNFKQENKLFDAAVIKQKQFKKAYVINLSGLPDSTGIPEIIDTSYIYFFDTLGIIKEIKRYDIYDKEFFTIFSASKNIDSIIRKTIVTSDDSTIIECKYGILEDNFDSLSILKQVYNNNGWLIEEELHATKKFLQNTVCATGTHHCYKFDYDSMGRIIYFNGGNEYCKIYYTDFGKIIETYENVSDKLIEKENILIDTVYEVAFNRITIAETGKYCHCSKQFQDGLLKFVTEFEIGPFPLISYVEIRYE